MIALLAFLLVSLAFSLLLGRCMRWCDGDSL